MRSLTLQYYIR